MRLKLIVVGFVAAAVGAGLMYLGLRHLAYFTPRPTPEQIIGPKTERDKACEQFGQEHRRKIGTGDALSFTRIYYFYSEKLDTCIQASEDQTKNNFLVVDIAGGFIKPSLEGLGDMGQALFDCDSAGVDHTIIEKVREHRGYVWGVPYAQYMDDFNGGPPRTVKSSPRMVVRDECEKYFHKELKEVR
jgi:hypothetical protein